MTAAESKTVASPGGAFPAFPAAPLWRRLGLFGTAVGIHVQGPHLRVTVARVRPFGALHPASFLIRDYRTRPAAEWRTEYQQELKKNGVSDASAMLLLPRSEVIVRVAQFPGVADKDMQSALSLELDTLHPYGDEPVNWAWTRVAPAGSAAKAGAVLIGIVRSTTLERYETLFREAGIPVSGVTFSASAIYSALRLYRVPPGEVLTWAETGEQGGEVYGESPSRTIFTAETGASMPSALALGAAELRLPDNAQAVPLDALLPPRGAAAGGGPASGPPDTLAWAAALAGAASWIAKPANLLPAERRETVSRGRLIPTFVLAICVITVVIALALQRQIAQRQYLRQLNQQIARLQPQAVRSSSVERRIAQTRGRIDLLDRYRARTKDDIDIINELTRLLPPPVWISSLEIHADNVIIAGEADKAGPLLAAIDSSPLFRNSEFGGALGHGPNNTETFRIKTMRRKPQ